MLGQQRHLSGSLRCTRSQHSWNCVSCAIRNSIPGTSLLLVCEGFQVQMCFFTTAYVYIIVVVSGTGIRKRKIQGIFGDNKLLLHVPWHCRRRRSWSKHHRRYLHSCQSPLMAGRKQTNSLCRQVHSTHTVRACICACVCLCVCACAHSVSCTRREVPTHVKCS